MVRTPIRDCQAMDCFVADAPRNDEGIGQWMKKALARSRRLRKAERPPAAGAALLRV